MRGTLFDLQEGVDAAKRGAGGPLPGVTFTAGDVFESVPEGADAYLFRHLLHDYDDDDCMKMLKNVRRAMKPDSRVLVLEKTVPTDDTPGPGRWLDLHVMLLTGGRERTVPEYQALFEQGRPEARARAADRASGGRDHRSGRRPVMNAVEYCLLHGLKVAGPEHPALLSAGEVLSYGALEQRVSQFAAGLREAGVKPSDRVGMLMLDTPDIVAMHLAAMAAGAIAVAMSSRAGAEELEQILAIVRPAVLVIDGEFAELAAAAIAKVSPQTRLIRRERELAAWKSAPAAPLVPVPRKPDDPAFWVMTSGTTGVPKAVEHHHRNVGMCAEYYEQVLGCTRDDRMFATSRFHFAYAIGNMFAALRHGRGQHPAGALGHRAERRRDGGALQADRAAQRPRRLSPAARSRSGARPRRSARFAISSRPASGMPPQIWTAWEEAGGHPDPRRPRLLGMRLHDHRQHAGAPQTRLVRPCDAERRASHRR